MVQLGVYGHPYMKYQEEKVRAPTLVAEWVGGVGRHS